MTAQPGTRYTDEGCGFYELVDETTLSAAEILDAARNHFSEETNVYRYYRHPADWPPPGHTGEASYLVVMPIDRLDEATDAQIREIEVAP